MAMWSQNLYKALQKFGRGACLIPVRFKFVTEAAADAALNIAYAKTWNGIEIKSRNINPNAT